MVGNAKIEDKSVFRAFSLVREEGGEVIGVFDDRHGETSKRWRGALSERKKGDA